MMGISCSCNYDDDGDAAWYWLRSASPLRQLTTKRARKCCSCGTKIKVGDDCKPIKRWRPTATDIEYRIHGEEVPLCTWYQCEDCSALADALERRGVCYSIDMPMEEQVKEYNAIAAISTKQKEGG